MSDSGWLLQEAIYNRLLGAISHDGAVVPVLDAVPEGQTYPYILIGDGTSNDWSSKTHNGQSHLFTIHIWSDYQGRKEVREIMSDIYDLLHNQPMHLVGHKVVSIRFDFGDVFKDTEGTLIHGIQRYRVLVSQEA